jgi:hypothetical protein
VPVAEALSLIPLKTPLFTVKVLIELLEIVIAAAAVLYIPEAFADEFVPVLKLSKATIVFEFIVELVAEPELTIPLIIDAPVPYTLQFCMVLEFKIVKPVAEFVIP